MVNLADFLDTQFLVPCKRCTQLLQEGERFCRFCGQDQSETDITADAGSEFAPRRGFGGAKALSRIGMKSATRPHKAGQGAIGHSLSRSAGRKEAKSEIGLVHADAFWQKEVLGGDAPEHWAGSSVTRYRLVIGVLAALVALLAFVLIHDLYIDKQAEAGKRRDYKAIVEQVQGALSRGDLGSAERALDVLDAGYGNDPGVQQLRDAYDRQVQKQEQAAQRDARDAAVNASRALGLGEPAAPPAQAPSPPEAPVVAAPAPAIGVAVPQEKECNETLAALALCQKK